MLLWAGQLQDPGSHWGNGLVGMSYIAFLWDGVERRSEALVRRGREKAPTSSLTWRELGAGSQGKASCLGWNTGKVLVASWHPLSFSPVARIGYFTASPLYGLRREQRQTKKEWFCRVWGVSSHSRCAFFSSSVCYLKNFVEDEETVAGMVVTKLLYPLCCGRLLHFFNLFFSSILVIIL